MLNMTFGKKNISTSLPAFVMGILNVTPDSFYNESRGGIDKAYYLIDQGADIIDIGGESTRPGFEEVTAEEEIKRIIPVVREIRKKSNIVISIDTRKFEVIKAAFEEGADVLNDVSALENDERKADFIAKNGLSVVLMNNSFNDFIKYSSAVESAVNYLKERIQFAKNHNISDDKIILDPGIGFGKTFEEDTELIKNLNEICNLNYPVLMGLSRKRCIGVMTAHNKNELKPVEKRLAGTLAAGIVSVTKGAQILRVHDVEETLDTLRVLSYTV